VIPAVFTYVDDLALWLQRMKTKFARNHHPA